ncbi:MAG: hypothetical protein RIC16_08890 [Rhodospirillales bacterium]
MPDRASARSREKKHDPWKLTRLETIAMSATAKADPSFDDTVPVEAPKDPAERVKWIEAIGGHPLAAADRFRAERLGEAGNYDGDHWWRDADGPTLDLVRDGDPGPEAEFDPADEAGDLEIRLDDDVLPPLPDDLARDALRPKWEAFARLYAYGHSAADAARYAGYAWHRAAQSGWRLLQDERIRARVDQLTRHLYGSEAWDAAAFVTRLEAVYREAMHRGQYAAAVRAVEAAARIESREKGPKKRRRK